MSNLQKNLTSKPQVACKRLIDTLWAVAYEEVSPGEVVIIALSNDPKLAYSKERQLPTHRMIETDDARRTVIGLEITNLDGSVDYFNVINQQNIFSYMQDFEPLQLVQDSSNIIKSNLTFANKSDRESDFVNAAKQSKKAFIDGMIVDDIVFEESIIEFYVGNRSVTVTRDHLQWADMFMLGYFRNVESPSLDKRVVVKFA